MLLRALWCATVPFRVASFPPLFPLRTLSGSGRTGIAVNMWRRPDAERRVGDAAGEGLRREGWGGRPLY